MKIFARILVACLIILGIYGSMSYAGASYSLDGSITSHLIQANQVSRSARNASMTIQIGGLTNGFPVLNNTSTSCFNQPGPGPAYAYGIFLDFSSINMSQCEAFGGTDIIRQSGAFIIDPFTAPTTKATPTQIANAMVAKGTLGTAFTITSGGGRDVIFTRTNSADGNIVYTDSNFQSSDAFRVVGVVSGQSALTSLVQQSEFVPANIGSGEVYLMDIDGYTYTYTAQASDTVSDVTAGLVQAYNVAPVPYVTCTNQTTRVFCTGNTDAVSFSIDAYVTYPTADTTAPLVTLVGSPTETVEFGSFYTDSGATWIDNRDGTGTISLATSGAVNPNSIGVYTLEYRKTDLASNTSTGADRTVIVTDTTAPSFVLIGNNNITVEIDTGYTDEGANWTDLRDGSGTVFASPYTLSSLGTKLIQYVFVDQSGNTGSVSRTLNVVDTIDPTLNLITTHMTVDANLLPVRGTISGQGTVTISGGASPVTLSNVNTSFTAYVPLTQNSLNTLQVTVTDIGSNIATGSIIITESGSVSGFSGATSVSGSTLSGVTSFSGGSLTGATRVVVEAPIYFGGASGAGIIPSNTIITNASGGIFDATAINSLTVTVTGGLASHEIPNGALEFGISNIGLNFSKPVKIEIPVPGYSGTTIPVKVKHGGTSTYVTTGLTNLPTATCTSGQANISSNSATVVNGVATIYTCAASTFVTYTEVSATPSASTGGGGGGGGYIPTTTTIFVTAQSGTTLAPPAIVATLSGTVTTFSIDRETFRKSKIITTATTLKNGTRITVSRILANGKTRKIGTARVIRGTIKYRVPTAGKYTFMVKQ